MARRQALQRLVRKGGEEVEVAEEGQRVGARREAETAAASAAEAQRVCVEDGDEAGGEEEGGGGDEEVSCRGHFSHGG
jgi:hypothetical protein